MMEDEYMYSPGVFEPLVAVLQVLEDEIQQIPLSIKCFPAINDPPHVHMEDTPAFRRWALDNTAKIVPADCPGRVKQLVVIGRIRVYAIIPAEESDEWGERL